MREFWLDFLSNSLATFLGLTIGIPIAFWVERKLELRRKSSKQKQNNEKIEDILDRVLIQVVNAEQKLHAMHFSQHSYFLYVHFSEIEVIDTMRNELTELETDWDVLLTIDLMISHFKSLNHLLQVNRELFALKTQDKLLNMSEYSKKFDSEFFFLTAITSDAIASFRNFLFERYPNVKNRTGGNKKT